MNNKNTDVYVVVVNLGGLTEAVKVFAEYDDAEAYARQVADRHSTTEGHNIYYNDMSGMGPGSTCFTAECPCNELLIGVDSLKVL